MQTVLLTGGTGLVGKAFTQLLTSKGYQVIILSRGKKEIVTEPNVTYAQWNVATEEIDIEAVKKADYIIHLAGAGVMDKKWTEQYKKEIVDSRVKSGALIVNTLKNNEHNVKAIVSASAIGYYGEDKIDNYFFTETDKPAEGFLGSTCQLWEDSIDYANSLGIRVAKVRIGIVFSNNGGALAEFVKPLKFKLATILGKGSQVISWIHIDDLCRFVNEDTIVTIVEDDQMGQAKCDGARGARRVVGRLERSRYLFWHAQLVPRLCFICASDGRGCRNARICFWRISAADDPDLSDMGDG